MLGELCDDLLAERADLIELLRPLDEPGWLLPTPAPGWSVLDQITHLAWSDEMATLAIVDPDAFRAQREEAVRDIDEITERVAKAHRHLRGADALPWLEHAGRALVDTARAVDPSRRVPWFGPEMSVPSSITARIMETWAHGQDVADTLGVVRAPTPRLRHVAFLGWRALPNSFSAQGRPVPDEPVRVHLGDHTFGPDDAANVVRGPLLDFCLVVTQRRHLDDTALVAEGPVATEWLSIAQAFAGPPGAGRRRGQFS